MSTRIVLDLLARFTTDRARPVHSRASNPRWLIIVRGQRHFRMCFHAWTSSWIALALGKWPGPIRSTVGVLDRSLDGGHTHHRKPSLKLCQIISAQYLVWRSRTPRHDAGFIIFAFCSPTW